MNNKIKFLIPCFFLFFFSFSALEAGSISPELQSIIATNYGYKQIDVIIQFKEVKNLKRTNTRKNEIIKYLKNKNINSKDQLSTFLKINTLEIKDLWLNNSIAITIPAKLIPFLSSLNNISGVRLDRKITIETVGQGSSPTQPNWNITAIGADAIWEAGITGEGVIIGSMDTGVDLNHPDLSIQWRGGSNSWFDPYGIHPTPYDSNGHGTQTTGLMIGGDTSGTPIGVAPGAKWIAAKIFDDSNTASLSAIHLAFQWMLDPDGNPDTDDAANIINNSWNFSAISGQCDYEFQNDISILRSADIAVIFSAGNSGPSLNTSHSPANNEDTISIGASDEFQSIPLFSSRGPSACDDGALYPKLIAPGVNVITTNLTFGGIFPDSYTYTSGTSYATSHVSGALALLQSKYPSSSLEDREEALFNTATIIGSLNDSGNGIINVHSALQYMFKVRLLSPNNNNISNTPTYTWSNLTGATQYYLWVNDSTGNIIQEFYSPEQANCNETSCSASPASALANGNATWWIQASNTSTNGPWSSAQSFTVGTPPDMPTTISPGGIRTPNLPSYTWDAISSATEYFLWVNDSTGNVIREYYSPAQANCNETSCSILHATALANGHALWWVQASNISGKSPWSHAQRFTVGIPPNTPILVSPNGGETSNLPTYTWNAVPTASQYFLWVNDSTGNVIQQLYTTEQASCDGVTCAVRPSTILANGNTTWWVQAFNSAGNGDWSNATKFITR